ncbi:MAG: hypothetical protein Q8P07_05050 [bacterium]|nr:hypothetical protein [bacterium]
MYSINHFKISSAGLYDKEIDIYGDLKLYDTVSEPQTLLVFADASTGEDGKGKTLSWTLKRESERLKGKLAGLLKKSNIISERLAYPYAQQIKEKPIEERKRFLNIVHESEDLKAIDISVYHPGSPHFSESIGNPRTAEYLFDPDYLYGYGRSDNLAFLQKEREIVMDLKDNPKWAEELSDRIMLEPNYTYAGPETIKKQTNSTMMF